MNNYLVYFTIPFTDAYGEQSISEGAIPFKASHADSYAISEAILKGIPGATFANIEVV